MADWMQFSVICIINNAPRGDDDDDDCKISAEFYRCTWDNLRWQDEDSSSSDFLSSKAKKGNEILSLALLALVLHLQCQFSHSPDNQFNFRYLWRVSLWHWISSQTYIYVRKSIASLQGWWQKKIACDLLFLHSSLMIAHERGLHCSNVTS